MATAAMATCSFSFGLRVCSKRPAIRSTIDQFTPFTKKRTSISKLSSSHSISGIHPLVLDQASAPFCRNSRPMTVVCAKGYKMKTHKASAKRFRVSGSGKIMRRRAGKQHLLAKKNTKRKLRLSKMV
ncbi:hypothetical protein F511_38061 [Dorcoceras hygrometricum]|uniref:50S ribosomal protein L35 n=1 Tax=Dorcoceras hygrometricum TaxID=472368 RepID=A0A2Z7A2G1_9LAMI|nr:hypothetical protein F511_38061 [Dorcoceras hygrometricum]